MSTVFTGTKPQDLYNRPLYGFRARFALSESIAIPYFLTPMPVERAIDELKIAEQVPPSLSNRWSLNELYQREIDRPRVDKDLVRGYLADPHKLKFFNALTVVLMPKDSLGQLKDYFNKSDSGPPIPWDGSSAEDAQWARTDSLRLDFDGVQYVTIGDQARLRWNTETVHAVAVDGQHRLVALQDYKEKIRNKVLTSRERETTIPVLFVLLYENAGLDDPRHTPIRVVARELFTDLNKNAKPVDDARELILDDWSINSLCTRTLVTLETARDSTECLPLTLVRWQDASNRFDQEYYLNSLVHLSLLTSSVLSLQHPRDPLDQEEVEEFIGQVGATLGEDGHLRDGDRTLLEVYRADYMIDGEPQVPMSRLPSQFLGAAVEGFERKHKPWIIKMLTGFEPYARLLRYARAHNLIEGVFGQYWAQTKQHRATITQAQLAVDPDWKLTEIDRHVEAITSIKGKDAEAEWAFKAVFQKALVRLGRVVEFESAGDPNLGNVGDVLGVLNRVHAKGVLQVGVGLSGHAFGAWAFIATNPVGGKIKVSRAVENRLLAILRLWYYANRKLQIDIAAGDPAMSARKLLQHFRAEANVGKWPGCAEAVKVLIKAMDTTVLHGDKQLTEKGRDDNVLRRLAAVLEMGIVEDLAKSDDE